MTVLHEVAARGDVAELQRLLARGADISARDDAGSTPLHWAAHWGNVDCARLLIDAGVDISARDAEGRTPLHWAAYGGRTDCARLLIEAGAAPTREAIALLARAGDAWAILVQEGTL